MQHCYQKIAGEEKNLPRPAGVFEYIKDAEVRNFAVVNANIKSKGATAAIAPRCNNSTITNCYVKDSVIDGKGNSAGIISYIEPTGSTIKKCKVISTSITSTSLSAGIAAISAGDITIEGCNVVNTKESTMQLNAGILYFVASGKNNNINKCNAQNIELKDTYSAGILGTSSGNTTIDNCNTKAISGVGSLLVNYIGDIRGSVSNVSITNCSSQSSTMHKGACMIREIELNSSDDSLVNVEKCTMKDIKTDSQLDNMYGLGLVGEVRNTKNVTIKNCDALNISFSGLGYSDFAAGILAHADGYVNNVEISNCHVDNMKTTGGQNVGGIIGLNQAKDSFILKECTSNNVTIGNSYRSAGGILGFSEGRPMTVQDCTVANFNATQGTNNDLQHIGGALGFTGTYGNVTVERVKVSNSKLGVVSTRACTIGGICGFGYIEQLNDCHVKDIEINGKGYEAVGGIIGIAQNSIAMTKNSVDNCKISCDEANKEAKQVGGIIGQAYANANINDSIVNKFIVDFDSTTGRCEFNGGVVGLCGNSTVTIDNVNVNHSNLKSGARTGGMIGHASKANVTNSKVYETWLYMHNNDNSMRAVGGAVGYASTSNIDNVTVDHVGIGSHVRVGGIVGFGDNINISNSKVDMTGITVTATARSTYAGGIAGYAPSNCKIESCSLYGTEIRLTGDAPEASVGGIVGHGNNYLYSTALITKCELDGCKFQGTSGVGGIAGVAVTDISDCHTKNTYVEGTVDNIGGILGYGGVISTINSTTGEETKNRKSVNITNCTIVDGYLSGPSTGNIIGKNSHMTSTPDVTEDVIEGCTYQFKETE